MTPERGLHGRKRKELEPRNNIGVVFPGQGEQRVGMGLELYGKNAFARKTWEEADKILGFQLSRIAFEGPPSILVKTTNAQPAIFVDSYIRQTLLEQAGIIPHKKRAVAGHSLGEINALVAAGVFTFEDAVLLVKRRSEFMQEACEEHPGGMVAVKLGDEDERILYIVEQFELEKGIVNNREQTVLSGRRTNLEDAINYMKEKGIVGTPLDVAGAYHSSLMNSAARKLSEVLRDIRMNHAKILIIANTTAAPMQTPDEIRKELEEQLTHCVLWAKTLERMPEETHDVSESGILSRMMQKVHQGKGKIETMKKTVGGAVINFSVWKRQSQVAPQLA